MSWTDALFVVLKTVWVVDQRVVVNGATSSWCPVNAGIPQGSVLESVLFNIFVNDMDESTVCNLSKFTDNAEFGGSVVMLEGRKALQRDLDSLHQCAKANSMTFNKVKCWILYLGHNNLIQHYRFVKEWLESGPAQKDLGVLVGI
ncbi:hypothetical protein WISP_25766 [Willisornis vidua]|uniref:Reverse transcriptase domain-containing protein n=1 Tax=Willisornis vidua TaxID=1566151 RepID=A0ABQ9DLZ1_9PASS|nr:hypothetical protein WISP_25766 [Willisornis vidua]